LEFDEPKKGEFDEPKKGGVVGVGVGGWGEKKRRRQVCNFQIAGVCVMDFMLFQIS
jgi:hypothetical protein